MNILVLTVDYPPIEGGISTLALNVSRELAGMGHDVTVVAPWFEEMEAFDRNEPYTVIRHKGYHLGWLRFGPFFATARRYSNAADLILAINIAYGGFAARYAQRRYGAPYLTFAYAYEFLKFARLPFVRKFFVRLYENSRRVIAISQYTKEKLVEFGVNEALIAVIHPGAPDRQSFTVEELAKWRDAQNFVDGPMILAVGRFIPRKGHQTLVRAFPAVLKAFPAATLVLVGDGPEVPAVQNEIHRLDLNGRVRLTGKVSDDALQRFYAACTLFALPAEIRGAGQVEGFGLVYVEAQNYGKPVVACKTGGVEDAIVDGETGVFVEPGNPEALAAAIVDLLGDAERARKLGEAGCARVAAELNWREFTTRMMAEFEAAQ